MAIAGFRRVAIVGCGLIGGSLELAIKQQEEADVVAIDKGDDLTTAGSADLIVLAAPILENIGLLASLKPHVSPRTFITDTGSTKAAIVLAAAGMRFVGGHPVAGGAASGRVAARADLFAGRPWVLTPSEKSASADVDRVRAFVERLGAIVHVLAPDEHDRLFAFVSHLPQLVVSALMDVAGAGAGVEGLRLAGAGLRDSTRLAESPPGIWRDILETNHANIAASLNALIAVLETYRDDPNGDALAAIFERAVEWRGRLRSTQ